MIYPHRMMKSIDLPGSDLQGYPDPGLVQSLSVAAWDRMPEIFKMKMYFIFQHCLLPSSRLSSPAILWRLGINGQRNVADRMVDLGTPLAFGQKVNVDDSSSDSTRQVCEYSILRAESIEDVKKMLQGHPHLSGWNNACEIEVHEVIPLPG